MHRDNKNIPVYAIDDNFSQGIAIEKINIKKSDLKTIQQIEETKQSHRDEGHTFHIVDKGTVIIEIDFEKYRIKAPTVVYMHPNQVHRILDFKNITVCTLSITNENLNPYYVKLLENIVPTKPLKLAEEANSIISDIFTICLNLSMLKDNKLYNSILKDSCNSLVAYLASQFLNQNKLNYNISRLEIIAKSFNELLEKNYKVLKKPSEYAQGLNISTSYLNECIKKTTGNSVSQNIQDRVILEAKRLLYHTDKSVKEISFELGYTDYPYFTRFFSKMTGMSALSFRNKKHD